MQEAAKRQQPQNPVDYYPSLLLKVNIVMMVVFVLVAVVLAGFFPVGLEDPADPTDNLYVPKPEWYFMFFYQLLKYFPGKLEPMVATVVSFGGFLVLLMLVVIAFIAISNPLLGFPWQGCVG